MQFCCELGQLIVLFRLLSFRKDSDSLRDVTFMNFLQLLPQVGEVNSMSEELAKKHHNANVKFDPLIKNLGESKNFSIQSLAPFLAGLSYVDKIPKQGRI